MISGTIDLNIAYHTGNKIDKMFGLPIVIHEKPGTGPLIGVSPEVIGIYESIVAGGFGLNANKTSIGPGFVFIEGSGVPAAHILLQTGNGNFTNRFATISSSGIFVISANGDLIINQNGSPGVILIENRGDGTGLGGQLILSAFNGSGQLEYGFGPYEGWYARNSHHQLELLPTSGQVEKIIVQTLRRFHLI